LRDFQQRSGTTRVSSQARINAADASPSILARERILRGHSPAQAAAATGMREDRYKAIEARWSTLLSPAESAALRKYSFGLDPDILLADNTPEARAKTVGRF
jgi:hypothetical protein